MREYDIFVPLFYNDGKPVETAKFQNLQKWILQRFDGITVFPQPNKGTWKIGNVVYEDEIVIYRVFTDRTKKNHTHKSWVGALFGIACGYLMGASGRPEVFGPLDPIFLAAIGGFLGSFVGDGWRFPKTTAVAEQEPNHDGAEDRQRVDPPSR